MTQDPIRPDAGGPPQMTKPGRRGMTPPVAATRYSWRGVKAAWLHEKAFRMETTLAPFLLVWTVSVWHYFHAPWSRLTRQRRM